VTEVQEQSIFASGRRVSSGTCGTSTLEAYYLNHIAIQLYEQISPNSRKIQYWRPGSRIKNLYLITIANEPTIFMIFVSLK